MNTYVISTDMDKARAACERYEAVADQAACNYGSISIDGSNRQLIMFTYCASLSSETLRAVCYQNMFYELARHDRSVEDAVKSYCKDDAACLRGAEEYIVEPLAAIQRLQ